MQNGIMKRLYFGLKRPHLMAMIMQPKNLVTYITKDWKNLMMENMELLKIKKKQLSGIYSLQKTVVVLFMKN